jgi:putative oxidoreductase
MKKWRPIVAGIVLGLLFVMASVMFFLELGPKPIFPEGSAIAHFSAAFGPTGYLKFVKLFELIGGLLVMIPRLRNFGLLLLGPVIVNIVAYHMLVDDPTSILNIKFMWMLYIILGCALYLFWDARRKFANLLD